MITINKKIVLAFCVMVALIFMVGGVGFVGLSNKISEMEQFFQRDLALLVQALQVDTEMLQHRRYEKDFLLNIGKPETQIKYLQQFQTKATSIREKIKQVDRLSQEDQHLAHELKQQLSTLPSLYEKYHQAVMDLTGQLKNQPDLTPQKANELLTPHKTTVHTLESIIEAAVNEVLKKTDAKVVRAIDHGKWMKNAVFIFVLAGCILGIGLGWLVSRSVNRPLNRIMEHLAAGATQVSSASSQVSSASQSMAEGASEQAAGLQETSSSIEEMASMTKKNAENADQANKLMIETSKVVEEANRAMKELIDSMRGISATSEETAKIVKTIDEIAFQTNLLALNAAVEAARAGEAGAGFAVVADEVRNLAMRAAEAAKSTASLIAESIKNIKDGSEIVNRTNEAFGKVAVSSKKVVELMAEIAAASQEQAQGIEQINKAVSEMDKVVQKNAASAEESASAAEEMNLQAEAMRGFVRELIALVGGRNGNGLGIMEGTALKNIQVEKTGGNGDKGIKEVVSRIGGISVSDSLRGAKDSRVVPV